jgi:hypothetical protein
MCLFVVATFVVAFSVGCEPTSTDNDQQVTFGPEPDVTVTPTPVVEPEPEPVVEPEYIPTDCLVWAPLEGFYSIDTVLTDQPYEWQNGPYTWKFKIPKFQLDNGQCVSYTSAGSTGVSQIIGLNETVLEGEIIACGPRPQDEAICLKFNHDKSVTVWGNAVGEEPVIQPPR